MRENELSKLFHLASALARDPKHYKRWIAIADGAPQPPSAAMKEALREVESEFGRVKWNSNKTHHDDIDRIGRKLMAMTSEGPVSAGRALLYAVGPSAVSPRELSVQDRPTWRLR